MAADIFTKALDHFKEQKCLVCSVSVTGALHIHRSVIFGVLGYL